MGRERTAATWYEPLTEPADIEMALHWAMGRPGNFVISTGDIYLLPSLLEAAERFSEPPEDDEMAELVARLEMEPLFV